MGRRAKCVKNLEPRCRLLPWLKILVPKIPGVVSALSEPMHRLSTCAGAVSTGAVGLERNLRVHADGNVHACSAQRAVGRLLAATAKSNASHNNIML